jgi:hypothetical protein
MPPPLFIVAVNLYLIYVLFKKPRAKPRTLYCEQQNTKLVFDLDDGLLAKPPAPPSVQSFVYKSLDKEQVPKSEVIESVPTVIESVPTVIESVPTVIESVPTVIESVPNIILDTVVVNLEPDLVNTSNNILETDPSIYAKYFTNFDRIAFSQTNIKNYTVVVQYENKTASISNSDYVGVVPFYMNVVALMNPK